MARDGGLNNFQQLFVCFLVVAPIYFVVAYWQVTLFILALTLLLCGLGWAVMRLSGVHESRKCKRAAIIKRCEDQHAALMDGDTTLGFYGQYPPADTCGGTLINDIARDTSRAVSATPPAATAGTAPH